MKQEDIKIALSKLIMEYSNPPKFKIGDIILIYLPCFEHHANYNHFYFHPAIIKGVKANCNNERKIEENKIVTFSYQVCLINHYLDEARTELDTQDFVLEKYLIKDESEIKDFFLKICPTAKIIKDNEERIKKFNDGEGISAITKSYDKPFVLDKYCPFLSK